MADFESLGIGNRKSTKHSGPHLQGENLVLCGELLPEGFRRPDVIIVTSHRGSVKCQPKSAFPTVFE